MKWNDYFKVVLIDNPEIDKQDTSSWTFDLNTPYYLYQVCDPEGRIVGTYKDLKYAVKQAKYKFKRLQSEVEKILLR